MKRQHLPHLLIALSIALLFILTIISFATYVPRVTAAEMQNIYIRNILVLGGASTILQISALVLLVIQKGAKKAGKK